MKVIVFDTETTGFARKNVPLAKQPYIVQRGSVEYNFEKGMSPDQIDFHTPIDKLFKPTSGYIPKATSDVHGITMDMVKDKDLIYPFLEDMILGPMQEADLIVAHNASFDMNMLWIEAMRMGNGYSGINMVDELIKLKPKVFCTMKKTTDIVKAAGNRPGQYKRPKLQQLHKFCFDCMFEDAHNAFADVEATGKCFVDLVKKGVFTITDDKRVLVNNRS